MIVFQDYYQNEVKLSFSDHPFSKSPKHVWVICRHNGRWLLTDHRNRGLEFPGGKVEIGETADVAALREVHEETGGRVDKLIYIGQYEVKGKGGTIIKNVYFAEIESLEPLSDYYETNGPVLMQHLPKDLISEQRFSFMMKDQVLKESLKRIDKIKNSVQDT